MIKGNNEQLYYLCDYTLNVIRFQDVTRQNLKFVKENNL